jgi:hypothetical protein
MQNFTDEEWRPPEGEVFADDARRSLGWVYRIYTRSSVSRRAARVRRDAGGLCLHLALPGPPFRQSASIRATGSCCAIPDPTWTSGKVRFRAAVRSVAEIRQFDLRAAVYE